ncbi:MAG: metal ABC transporter ATP-binding protein [Bacteroidetes bacterium]|nr:metal ABC transporter ATP-binding protein [Bacteroidota bacterium]
MEGLSVSYDRKTALSNIYLNIEPGYVYGLIGGNGSGKSTLFKSILGLVEPDAGNITINESPIDDVRKFISYIPQKEEIDWSFPATVFDIVLMGRYPHQKVFDRLKPEDKQKALQAMEMLGITDLKDKQIGELSGGQQQRAFIARALCQEAEIYMFDEPFVGVDITTENRIIEIVKDLAANGKLVIIIHHDLAKVKDYFDRLVMINQRVIAAGETELVFTDENIKKTYGGRLTILQKTENYL